MDPRLASRLASRGRRHELPVYPPGVDAEEVVHRGKQQQAEVFEGIAKDHHRAIALLSRLSLHDQTGGANTGQCLVEAGNTQEEPHPTGHLHFAHRPFPGNAAIRVGPGPLVVAGFVTRFWDSCSVPGEFLRQEVGCMRPGHAS
jgi:hypothetical protein